MKPSYDILRKAYALYVERDNIAYFYGAKGQVLTDKVMDALIAAEPKHFSKYTEAELKKIKSFSRGKIGYDCSGFVGACVGCQEWSGGLWSHCYNKTTVSNGKAGCILYKQGHVGLDIGYGYAMDIPTEGKTIRIFRNNTTGFIGAGEYRGFDYSEANNH